MVADTEGQSSRQALLRIKELQKRSEESGLSAVDRANVAMELGQLYARIHATDSAIQWIEFAARTYASLGFPAYSNQAGNAHKLAADLARQTGDWVTRAEFLRRAAWAFTSGGNKEAALEAQREADGGPTLPTATSVEPATARCARCGAPIAAGSRFCPSCGLEMVPLTAAPTGAIAGPSANPPGPPEHRSALATFLRFNAYDRFDLLELNSMDLSEIVDEARGGSRALLHDARELAETLLGRVRRETEQKEDVTALLGDLSAHWYLRTSKDPQPLDPTAWRGWATGAYSGLFYESRVPGGRRKPRLADRLLWTSRGRTGPDEGSRIHLFEKSSDLESSTTLQEASVEEILILRVAQAVLDDLAASPRTSDTIVTLSHLTSLAASATSREVNAALQSLLSTFDEGSFLLLDPGRFPGVSQVFLRWPNERLHPGVSRYDLLVSAVQSPPSGPAAAAPGAPSPSEILASWFEQVHSSPEWIEILTSLDRKRDRLPRPPARAASLRSPGYVSLRKALVEGSPATEIFERVRWKDQPRGLPMLNQLLLTGSFSSDIDTDRQYLEVELSDLAYGALRPPTDDGVWRIGGGRVVRREQAADGTTRYTVGADTGSASAAT